MKVTGSAQLHGPPERVYAILQDPAVLARTIPGCQQLDVVAPGDYRLSVTAGVASIKGSYLASVRLTEPDPPRSYTLRASGQGAPGTVDATARIQLAGGADGTTQVHYDADAVVGGTIGGVGQRVLATAAKRTAGQFFAAVDRELTGQAHPATTEKPTAAAPAPAAGSSAAAGAPVGASFPGSPPGSPGRATPLSLLAAAGCGALIALAGAAVGARLARRG